MKTKWTFWAHKILSTTSLLLISCFVILGQNQLLEKIVTIPNSSKISTKKEHLDYLAAQYSLVISYNANLLPVANEIRLKKNTNTIKNIIEEIFEGITITILTREPNKLIIYGKKIPKQKETYLISGHIYDLEYGETVNGAIVIENLSNTSVISNDKGYFVIEIPAGNSSIEVRYLGYKTQVFNAEIDNNAVLDFYLENDNSLPIIVINSPLNRINLIMGGDILDIYKAKEYKSILGERDLINNARILPGVQSGGEGQSGLFVRGGTPDQNLILLEGVSLYETSHTAGISSIFIEEGVKSANFIKNGFPARYSGRLSSVLDVQLKDGDKKKHQVNISMGLPGAKAHIEGPIGNGKTTYNLSARASWLNFYVNNLLKKYTKYNDINISYNDVLGKFTHNFNPTNSLSLAFYIGSDHLALSRRTENQTSDNSILKTYDRNSLSWGNKMATLRWNSLINEKLSFKAQAGVIKYFNRSRSSYEFNSILPDSSRLDQLDVLSSSNILDANLRADFEYFFSDQHVFRIGTNIIQHQFNPTIKQFHVILKDDVQSIVDKDSVILSKEVNFYAEDNFKLHTHLFAYVGLNHSIFKTGSKTRQSLQPRMNLIWNQFNNHMVMLSYSRTSQFIHLLSNSGLGLPSDLWVPSTDKIEPQHADQWSLKYSLNVTPNFYASIGGYTKSLDNSIEYNSPIELFYFLINNQNIVPIYNNSRDWERNVFVGKTKSKGLEFLLHRKEGIWKGWFSATYSKTDKYFDKINQGLPFPATNDRRWDLNAGLIHEFSSKFSVGMNFVYGTGNTFTLSTEEYKSFLGIELLQSNGRNNYRLPPFHHLSLNANYTHKGKLWETVFDLNLYNVYNRLNAYFIYIYKDPLTNTASGRKVSILPFTPSINIGIKF